MRNRIRLSEGQLRRVIKESVYRILESIDGENKVKTSVEKAGKWGHNYPNKKKFGDGCIKNGQGNPDCTYVQDKHGNKKKLRDKNGNPINSKNTDMRDIYGRKKTITKFN